jgi:phospholipid-translocating ATPase
MTLSIGDGANDVAMIQEANVGVGLFGLEGSQAAMSADYAFGQFRFLTKLLIVHGRWSYHRIADMHSNFFYKNVIWTLAMFWFLIYNSFDATYLYQYSFIMLYNLIFTSLPVMALGAFDQDINAKAAMAFPQLYIRGIRGLEYTRTKFWLYMLDGLYQSTVVFYIPYLVWTAGPAISWNGRTIESLSDFGTTVAVAAIITANSYVGINTNYWTIITWVIIPGSSLVMLLWIVVYSFFESFDFEQEAQRLCGGATFWGTVGLTVSIALLPRILVKFVSTSFASQDIDIVRYMWVKGNLKDLLGIRSRHEQMVPVDGSSSVLEGRPMFREPHARSTSEVSNYEPGGRGGPGDRTPPTQTEKLNGTPLQIGAALDSSGSKHRPLAPIVNTSEDEDMMPRAISPTGAADPTAMSTSPQPSYYSASDIPSPSPLPSPGFHDPSQAYSRVASISYSRPLRSQYLSPLLDHARLPPNSNEMPAHNRKLEESSISPERWELSAHSEASYELAAIGKQGDQRRSRSLSPAWRASASPTIDGPAAL